MAVFSFRLEMATKHLSEGIQVTGAFLGGVGSSWNFPKANVTKTETASEKSWGMSHFFLWNCVELLICCICPWRTRLCSFSWSFHCSTLHKQSYFISFSKFDVWLLMSWKDCRQPLCKWDPAKKKHPFRVKMVPVFVKRTGSTLELPLAPLSTALEIWSGCLRWWEFFTAAFFFPVEKGYIT